MNSQPRNAVPNPSFRMFLTAGLLIGIASTATGQSIPPPLPGGPAEASLATPVPTPVPANLFSPRRVSTLPFPVQMHGTAVVGDNLYVFGGNVQDQGFSDRSWSAQVKPDGSLSAWIPQLPLPELRHYTANAVEVVNGTIYICGGTVADERRSTDGQTRNVADVLYTTVQSDGSLSPWKRSAPFGQPRSLIATANDGRNLFVVGGARSSNPMDEVLSAPILPNGDLGPWRTVGKLPVPLWFHGAAILDSRLFVMGGLTGRSSSTASGRVWYADVNPNGTIGAWTEDKPLPVPLYGSACSGFNDYLVSIGGRLTGGVPTNNIVVAKLQDGRINQWQTLPTDLQTRYFHSLGLDVTRGWIFVTGGRFRANVQDRIGSLVGEVRGFQVSGRATVASPVLTSLGFTDLQKARAAAAGNKTILLYFRSPEVPSCMRFEESLKTDKNIASLLSAHALAAIDVSKDPKLSYQYGLFKVPSVAIVGPGGTLIRSTTGLRTAADLAAFLKQ